MTCDTIIEIMLTGIVGFFTALFGAAFGAYAAYFLASRAEEQALLRKHHGHAVTLLYMLIARSSAVHTFAEGVLESGKDSIRPDQRLNRIGCFFPKGEIDYASLSFLVDNHDSQFLVDLSVIESRYFNFLNAVDDRNIHHEKILESSHASEHDSQPGKIVRDGIDPHRYNIFIAESDNIARRCRPLLMSIINNIDELASIIERRFPDLPHPKPGPKPKMNEDNEQAAPHNGA